MRRSSRLARARGDDDDDDEVAGPASSASSSSSPSTPTDDAPPSGGGMDRKKNKGADEDTAAEGDAMLEYQAELRRRLGLDKAPRRGRLDHLLLARAGGALAPHTPSRLELMASIGSCRLPDTLAGSLDQFQASIFSAVFNRAGSTVAVACQDATISLYDTDQLLYRQAATATSSASASASAGGAAARSGRGPPQPALRPRKEIECRDVGWSIIGSAFSPDGRWIAYSSWSRYLHLANTWGEHCLHESYLVSPSRTRHFCLFSLAMSSDGTRVVGGGNDGGVHIIHLEQKEHSCLEDAHFDDVNTVAFLWPEQDSLLLSGSDDGLVKLWDLRCSGDVAQGLFVGHGHGITSVCSKGNGVHVVSNSKDQTARLWDVRKLRDASPEATSAFSCAHEWDYRWDSASGPGFGSSARRRSAGAPVDDSLLTFRGHRVARTLIQATFSPPATTGSRFVLTGSADGDVCVYDTLQASGEEVVRPTKRLRFHRDCVRTVAFSPHQDVMVSAGWDHRLGLWRFGGRAGEEEDDDN